MTNLTNLISTLSSLTDKKGKVLLNQNEIKLLIDLKSIDERSLLNTGNHWYKIIGQITVSGFDQVYNGLNKQKWKNFNDAYWKLPVFNLPKWRLQYELSAIKESEKVGKGLFKCPNPKCGSEETVSAQKQVRSADEPMTIIVRCVPCGNVFYR